VNCSRFDPFCRQVDVLEQFSQQFVLIVGRAYRKTCELVIKRAFDEFIAEVETIAVGFVRFVLSRRVIRPQTSVSATFADICLETIDTLYPWPPHQKPLLLVLELAKPNGSRKNYAFMKMQVIVLKDVLSG
jgi:hypothetical protein